MPSLSSSVPGLLGLFGDTESSPAGLVLDPGFEDKSPTCFVDCKLYEHPLPCCFYTYTTVISDFSAQKYFRP